MRDEDFIVRTLELLTLIIMHESAWVQPAMCH